MLAQQPRRRGLKQLDCMNLSWPGALTTVADHAAAAAAYAELVAAAPAERLDA